MANKYWIKLYYKILNEPRMAMLGDHLWRRMIELILLAGAMDKNGKLPPLDDIARRLRDKKELIEKDMAELEKHGVLHKDNGVYVVTEFAKSQIAMTSTQRVQRFREKKRKEHFEEVNRVQGIYKITNKISRMVYVGASIDCNKRIKSHFSQGKRFANYWMHDDLEMYGKKSFRIEIIEIVEDRDDLPERETYWINQFNKNTLYNTEMFGKTHRDR